MKPPKDTELDTTSTGEEAERYANRNLRWNLTTQTAEITLFLTGIAFASPVTVLPAFAERLGASNTLIGLIPAGQTVGWTLPGIFAANQSEQLSRKLPFLLRLTILERLPFMAIAIVAFFLAQSSPGLTLLILLCGLTVMWLIGGLLLPAWLSMMAQIVPIRIRGRFFAWSGVLGASLGLGASAVVGYVLDNFPYPFGYVICLAAASAVLWIGLIFFRLIREPAAVTKPPFVSSRQYFARLPSILRDANLSWYLFATAIASIGTMANGFFTVYALVNLGASEWQVGAFNFVLLAGQIACSILFGQLADRHGHKLIIVLGAVSLVLANLAAIFAEQQSWLIYLAFVGVGGSLASIFVSAFNIMLEFAPASQQPTYVAIGGLTRAPALIAAPIVGGLIADASGFHPVFIIAAVTSALGALMIATLVRDPRRVPSHTSPIAPDSH